MYVENYIWQVRTGLQQNKRYLIQDSQLIPKTEKGFCRHHIETYTNWDVLLHISTIINM